MMRSLYSGVSGLKVHQTKMDVIGNNIANVNTVGFKGSSVNFSDIFYQKTQSATGPNPATGAAGQNSMQVGLGATVASITTNITTPGGAQRTDAAFDTMINGDNFFIVENGGKPAFTKDGAFYVDGGGNLAMKHGGAKVLGWRTDPKDENKIIKGQASSIQVMSAENMQADAQQTRGTYLTGNIDAKDEQLLTDSGCPMAIEIYDQLGNLYTAKFSVKQGTVGTSAANPDYAVDLTDITDSKGKSIFVTKDAAGKYIPNPQFSGQVKFGAATYSVVDADIDQMTGKLTKLTGGATGTPPALTGGAGTVGFNGTTGEYVGVGTKGAATGTEPFTLQIGAKSSATVKNPFYSGIFGEGGSKTKEGIVVDFSKLTQKSTSDTCSLKGERGTADGTGMGKGCKVGKQDGLSIDQAGKIYATYDNGTSKLLGQIAVASFANPSGLEAIGNNLYTTTQNSGSFDGIGKDPSEGGDSISAGMLEMSNVDLSQQFTDMITTQRGFQANSRIITTSDGMLEELINLKR